MIEKELYNSSVNSLVISNELLNILSKKYIIKYKLENYVNNINTNSNLSGSWGNYQNKEIQIDLNEITSFITRSYTYNNIFYKSGDKEAHIYLYNVIIQVLYHELTHAKQDKQIGCEQTPIYVKNTLINSSLVKDTTSRYFYNNNHDLFPSEHNADVESYKELIQLSKVLNLNKYSHYGLINSYIKNYLVNDQDIVSPIEQLYINSNLVSQLNDLKNISPNITLYNRLSYGLPIESKDKEKLLIKRLVK